MTYVFDCDHQHDGLSFAEVKRLVGGKAANLTVMAVDLGLPVPPAFTITTAACNEYLAHGWPAGLDDELREHMARMELLVGQEFGAPANPLLVSVRSGAPISMPGMMDTILNLGLNDATTAGLEAASASPKFANNCRMRFEAMFRDIVGVDAVPEDPWAQLRAAVEAVFRSWNSDRARAYREHEGIADDLGTAVTVQAMVFGNRSVGSGTGVLFTRNPATGEPVLYGDVMFNAQGEDVVAGTHATEPIAILDERLPVVARELRAYATRLERHHRDLCEIEFTIEHGKLWMLQCRIGKRGPQAALRIAVDMAEDPEFPLSRADAVRRVADLLIDPPKVATERGDAGLVLVTGLGASPGVASGEIVTTPDAAVAAAEAGRTVILVRAETSPDDVHGMAVAAGVLTATGGLASHAAVVARGWGIPAVVGAAGVQIAEGSVRLGGRVLAAGETITIDGGTGEVFAGAVAGVATVAPEAATLLGWARDLGITIGGGARTGERRTCGSAGHDGSRGRGPGWSPGRDHHRRRAAGPRGQGLRDAGSDRHDTPLHCRRGERAPRPARRRRPGRDCGRFRPAHGRWQVRGPGADRRRHRALGRGQRDRRARRVPGPGPPDEGDRDRLADAGRRRDADLQRPFGRGLRRQGPRRPGGPPCRCLGVAPAAGPEGSPASPPTTSASSEPSPLPGAATTATSPRRAWTATTVPGSSFTRT